jgi:hypothetical protein
MVGIHPCFSANLVLVCVSAPQGAEAGGRGLVASGLAVAG